VADEGEVIIASDLISAEPSVTANYSKDPNYLDATLNMIGKRPFYNKDGLLKIDDIYLMVASRFPSWAIEVRQAFEAYYDGVQGYDLWLTNPEYLQKKVLKNVRSKSKTLSLSLAYGVGVNRMTLVAQQNQFDLSMAEAKAFKKLYWATFPLVKSLSNKLASDYKLTGVLQNDFGYCLYPSSDYKVLNSLIQSSVSGIIDLFNVLFFTRCPEAIYYLIIHDEVIFSVKEENVEKVRSFYYKCVDELNQLLGWSVPIRFGWESSKTFYIGK
jgi:hypothetical protein